MRDLFLKNLPIKLLAVLLAILLWVLASGRFFK